MGKGVGATRGWPKRTRIRPNGYLLAQLVNSWQWHKEAIDLLWAAARQPKTTAAALQSLWDLYSRTNETHELWRVARAQLELDPFEPGFAAQKTTRRFFRCW